MTQSEEVTPANPAEAVVAEGVETKEISTTPTNDVETYRKLQSQLDKERTEREKLAKDAEYWRSQADTYLTQEQKERIALEREKVLALQQAEELKAQLSAREAAAERDRLIAEKYPYLKDKELADIVSNVQGTKEEIDLALSQLDSKFRAASNILAKEESAKKSATSVSQAAGQASEGITSYEEFKQLNPEAQTQKAQGMFKEWRDSMLGR